MTEPNITSPGGCKISLIRYDVIGLGSYRLSLDMGPGDGRYAEVILGPADLVWLSDRIETLIGPGGGEIMKINPAVEVLESELARAKDHLESVRASNEKAIAAGEAARREVDEATRLVNDYQSAINKLNR